jgi:hypothetical protein
MYGERPLDPGLLERVGLPPRGRNTHHLPAARVESRVGLHGNAILAELNREFVLFDGNTFRKFIDFAPQARGRSFAGLLGLKRYSVLRQGLSGLANTRAFNNHFGTTDKQGRQNTAKAAADRARANIKNAYAALVGDEYDPAEAEASMLAKAHSALSGIALLKPLCEGRTFEQINPTACVEAAKAADGTEARNRLSKVLQDHTSWTEASAGAPTPDDASRLIALAEARDAALKLTQGDVFRQLYVLSDTILSDPSWDDPHRCPTCGRGCCASLATTAASWASRQAATAWASSGSSTACRAARRASPGSLVTWSRMYSATLPTSQGSGAISRSRSSVGRARRSTGKRITFVSPGNSSIRMVGSSAGGTDSRPSKTGTQH